MGCVALRWVGLGSVRFGFGPSGSVLVRFGPVRFGSVRNSKTHGRIFVFLFVNSDPNEERP